MKRSSSSRGSFQPSGVLKPRNDGFTPDNRQSGGSVARKSYIPKIGLAGNAKIFSSRKGRNSSENFLGRNSNSTRITPVRLQTPSLLRQTTTNRLSSDPVRTSGIGASAVKDRHYFNDPTFKTRCINKIFDFIKSTGLTTFQRRTLLAPTREDFIAIFTLIFKHLDPTFTMPNRMEDEIPKLLEKIKCPLTIKSSSFQTIGSPHTWTSVLGVLVYLVDIIHSQNSNPFNTNDDDDDDDEEDGLRRRRTECCMEFYKCKEEEESRACLENYRDTIKEEFGVSDRDLMKLEEEREELEHECELLPRAADDLKLLKQSHLQYCDDLSKMETYLQNLQVAIENKASLEMDAKQVIERLDVEERKLREEVNHLKTLHNEQGYSTGELIHLKNCKKDYAKEIEHQKQLREDLINENWKLEMDLSNAHSSLRNSHMKLEKLLVKLGVKESFEDIDLTSEDNHEAIMYKITTLKKNANKIKLQTQDKILKADQDYEMAKAAKQEKISRYRMLEMKIRHIHEEHKITVEEIAREEQLLLEENEALFNKIMEIRKLNKNQIYQIQQAEEMLNNKKQELANYKRKEETCLRDGAQFFLKLHERRLKFAEAKRNIMSRLIGNVNEEFDNFLEWFREQCKE